MERITNKTFDKKCKLIRSGWKVTGCNSAGLSLRMPFTKSVLALIFVCGNCKFNGNGCNPSASTDIKTEIVAKIE